MKGIKSFCNHLAFGLHSSPTKMIFLAQFFPFSILICKFKFKITHALSDHESYVKNTLLLIILYIVRNDE